MAILDSIAAAERMSLELLGRLVDQGTARGREIDTPWLASRWLAIAPSAAIDMRYARARARRFLCTREEQGQLVSRIVRRGQYRRRMFRRAPRADEPATLR